MFSEHASEMSSRFNVSVIFDTVQDIPVGAAVVIEDKKNKNNRRFYL